MFYMRVINVFLLFICIGQTAYSQSLDQYFLRPADKTGNSSTVYFRTHTAIFYDSNPCQDRYFYPHLTTPAHTLPGNQFAYQPFPGAHFEGLLLNSLSMGL